MKTLVATPDPEKFNIHDQPTWIALGIGAIQRNRRLHPIDVFQVSRELDTAWVDFRWNFELFRACLVKTDGTGIGRVVYIDPLDLF